MSFANKIVGSLLGLPLILITSFFLLSNSKLPFTYKVLLVQSGSMSPTIKTGDLVVVKSSSKYMKNDIISFVSENKFNVTHRIINIDHDKFITKGDANKTADQDKINFNRIIGKVIYTIPRFGYFIMFVKSLPGLIILIIIPSTIIVYEEIIQIKNNFKKSINR